jgi:hypothetical protein
MKLLSFSPQDMVQWEIRRANVNESADNGGQSCKRWYGEGQCYSDGYDKDSPS